MFLEFTLFILGCTIGFVTGRFTVTNQTTEHPIQEETILILP
jgi:hypothetical protein